jgi:hypothetical protein
MSRGYYIKFDPIESSDRARTYSVSASGWGEPTREFGDPPTVGSLTIDVPARLAAFVPSGPWADEMIVRRFSDWPVSVEDPGMNSNGYFDWALKRLVWKALQRPAMESVSSYV